MKHAYRSTLLVLFLLSAPAWNISAAERPSVQVNIEFPQSHPYGGGFDDAQRTKIQTDTARRITTLLNAKLQYIDFSESSGTSLLTIQFGDWRPVLDPNRMRDVGFWLAVDEKVTREPHQLFLLYRNATEYKKTLPDPPVAGLTTEFSLLIEDHLNREQQKFVQLLSRTVAVAASARRLDAPKWALPFTHDEMKMDNRCEFRIEAEAAYLQTRLSYDLYAFGKEVFVPADDREREWASRVVAETSRSDPTDPSPLTPERFSQLIAKQVFVTSYQRPRSKPVPRIPAAGPVQPKRRAK